MKVPVILLLAIQILGMGAAQAGPLTPRTNLPTTSGVLRAPVLNSGAGPSPACQGYSDQISYLNQQKVKLKASPDYLKTCESLNTIIKLNNKECPQPLMPAVSDCAKEYQGYLDKCTTANTNYSSALQLAAKKANMAECDAALYMAACQTVTSYADECTSLNCSQNCKYKIPCTPKGYRDYICANKGTATPAKVQSCMAGVTGQPGC